MSQKNPTTLKAEAGTHELVITRIFDAPQELVWSALTDRAMAAQWLGPEGLTTEIEEWGTKPGEAYRFTMRTSDGTEYPAHGIVKEVDKPRKFSYTWVMHAKAGVPSLETLVTVELKSVGNKTEMTFTHSGFPTVQAKDSHEGGWSSAFTKLEKLLRKEYANR